nr:MAG TPA: hypothetical protein [Caudoviricetes sp.]
MCIFLSINRTKYVAIILPTIPIISASIILIVSLSFHVYFLLKGFYSNKVSLLWNDSKPPFTIPSSLK